MVQHPHVRTSTCASVRSTCVGASSIIDIATSGVGTSNGGVIMVTPPGPTRTATSVPVRTFPVLVCSVPVREHDLQNTGGVGYHRCTCGDSSYCGDRLHTFTQGR